MRFPFLLSVPYGMSVCTLTLEEAIAYARSYATGEHPPIAWDSLLIRHDDGRRWHWEIKAGKPHLVETVDNKNDL